MCWKSSFLWFPIQFVGIEFFFRHLFWIFIVLFLLSKDNQKTSCHYDVHSEKKGVWVNEAHIKKCFIVLVFNISMFMKASTSLTSYRYHRVDSLPVAPLFLFAFSRLYTDSSHLVSFFLCSVHRSCTLEHFFFNG